MPKLGWLVSILSHCGKHYWLHFHPENRVNMLVPQSDDWLHFRVFHFDDVRHELWRTKLAARYQWDFGWKTGRGAYDQATQFASKEDAEAVVQQYLNDGGWVWSGGQIVYHPPGEEPVSGEVGGRAVQSFAF